MAKSTDCCVTDGCFCVAAKGLNLCLGCWDDMSVSFLGDVCQVSKCLNVPDEGETVCSACWTIHDNADLPGFPSEYEGDDQLGGCGTCNSPTNDWFCKSCYKTQDVIHIAAQEEEVLTQCTDSCKEMGMMSEGCDYCQ
jgi:hypothetical protein